MQSMLNLYNPVRCHLLQSISFYNVRLRPREGKGHARSTGEQGSNTHCNMGQWAPDPQIALLDVMGSPQPQERSGQIGREGSQFRVAGGAA